MRKFVLALAALAAFGLAAPCVANADAIIIGHHHHHHHDHGKTVIIKKHGD